MSQLGATSRAVVVGCSSGGLNALNIMLPEFPDSFQAPVIVVQHRGRDANNYLIESLDQKCHLRVKNAEDKEPLATGYIYFAPPDYHLLIESGGYFSLDADEVVRGSRPSIDELFYSAADVLGERLIGVVLTGANEDGSSGICHIKNRGGTTIAQDPETAEMEAMPKAAIASNMIDHVVPLDQISKTVIRLV